MAKKTVEIYECDGAGSYRCGKPLSSIRDGIVLQGSLRAPGNEVGSALLAGGWVSDGARSLSAGKPAEVAMCWACFHRATGCPDRLVEEPAERTDR